MSFVLIAFFVSCLPLSVSSQTACIVVCEDTDNGFSKKITTLIP